MSLILAVEPDRRQAAQLTGIIRHHVGAELILAETTEGALGAIGRRVPDLVLVPALLAPQDDAALASALRVIAAAAHVRTLTIPVFANGVSHRKRSGMLARLGLGREADKVPDGCEPTVFAEQVIAYLHEAAADREAVRPAAEPIDVQAPEPAVADAPPAVVNEAPDVASPEVYEAADVSAYAIVDSSHQQTGESQQTEAFVVAESAPSAFEGVAANACDEVEAKAYDEVAQPVFEAAPASAAEERPTAETPEKELAAQAPVDEEAETAASVPIDLDEEDQDIDLSDELLSLCEDETAESESEEVEIYSIDVLPEELFVERTIEAATAQPEDAMAEWADTDAIAELQAALEEPLPIAGDAAWEEPAALEADASDDGELELWMPLPLARRWPALYGMVSAPRPVFTEGFNENDFVREPHVMADATPPELLAPTPALVAPTPAPAARATAPAPAAAPSEAKSSEWVELIESLRLDIERLKTAPPAAAKPPRAAVVPKPEPAAKPAKRASKRAQPIQDEWGFFDPEQCGFAALLAKLDEITENPDEPGPHTH